MRGKVAVALSGGIDSSTVVALLQERGFEVVGITMKIWSLFPKRLTHAYLVAKKLGIEWHVIDLQKKFFEEVVSPFIEGYKRGRAINPCVYCNERVKFKFLIEKAEELGVSYLATGHYARVGFDSTYGRYFIQRGKDAQKDQSYMLYRLPQDILRKVVFPLGDYTKDEVRSMAVKFGLEGFHESKESFDLCFATPLDHRGFMKRMLRKSLKPGPILTLDGKVVGEHKGIPLYTIGQRRGLNVNLGYPAYVIGICPEKNALVVGPRELLEVSSFSVREVVWGVVPPQPLGATLRGYLVLRLHSGPIEAVSEVLGEDEVRFRPLSTAWLVTPGQSAVMYDEEGRILFGGIIEKVNPVRSFILPC